MERGDTAASLPLFLEAGYSSRSARIHAGLIGLEQGAKITLAPAPEIVPIAIKIQNALFDAGKGRAAGASDIQIAATAIHDSTAESPVIVVHCDVDFEHILDVTPELRTEWVLPRGIAD